MNRIGIVGLGATWLLVGMLVNGNSVAAYEETSVADGGVVSGKVAFTGTPSAPEHFRVQKNPEFCGAERDFYHVSVKDGVLLDAVVLIEGIEKGKPLGSDTVEIVGENCAFLPYTNVVAAKGTGLKGAPTMHVVNNDTVIHNPHPFEMIGAVRRSLWNLGLPQKGSEITKQLLIKKGNVVKLQCDQHDFMHSWTRVVKNPYWAIVGQDGSFSIDQVPPGKYRLVAWHPILGEQTQEVTIAAKGKAEANFTFSGK